MKLRTCSRILSTSLLITISGVTLPANSSDGPKELPALEKGIFTLQKKSFTSERLRGLGFGKDYCWELIYGENCTIK